VYNIRDLLGHFVKVPPRKNEEGMCPHACCRGRRPHPDRFPVILPRAVLRSATDAELERHFAKRTVGDSDAAVAQVVGELQRREDARERAAARKTRARGRRESRSEEYRLYVESEWTAAEAATRGNMLNKRGKAKGIDPRSLWTANDATRAAYASEELRRYWNDHRIVSASEFHSAAEQHRGGRRRAESRLYGVYVISAAVIYATLCSRNL
jgi:hypothetical protein